IQNGSPSWWTGLRAGGAVKRTPTRGHDYRLPAQTPGCYRCNSRVCHRLGQPLMPPIKPKQQCKTGTAGQNQFDGSVGPELLQHGPEAFQEVHE
ncbi:MAG: hypothetical protein KGI62_08910, partial [Xanthomonadaceae bacterium]|nr:hypothetical protein [Xanthomonadaceae bacterium]